MPPAPCAISGAPWSSDRRPPRLHYNLAQALDAAGQAAEAGREFEEALRLDPQFPEAHYAYGNHLVKPETWRCRRSTLRGRHPGEAGLCRGPEQSRQRARRPQGLRGARAHFEEALRIDPGFAEAHDNEARVLAAQGQVADALAHARRAVELKPDSSAAHYNLGQLLQFNEPTADAISEYRNVAAAATRISRRPTSRWEPSLGDAGNLEPPSPSSAPRSASNLKTRSPGSTSIGDCQRAGIEMRGSLLDRRHSDRPRASAAEKGYVNAALCRPCHAAIYDSYSRTGMARTFSRRTPCPTLTGLFTRLPGAITAPFERAGAVHLQRTEIGGGNLLERRIDFAIGSGAHSSTYVHRTAAGRLIELPVSWYSEDGGHWAMSPGYDRPDHSDFRREVTEACLFCHNGYPSEANGGLAQGIDCQRCHGPGRRSRQTERRHSESRQAVAGAPYGGVPSMSSGIGQPDSPGCGPPLRALHVFLPAVRAAG